MRGFTLIELMVVMAIMGILIVVTVPSYNQYNNNQKLADVANQLQTILRQVQNNAQTGTVCKIGTNVYTASSWVITLRLGSYNFQPTCVGTSSTPSPQNYPLPEGITISSVSDTISGCRPDMATASATISYANLSSEPSFDLGCTLGVNSVIGITLCLNCPSTNTKTVVIEKGGGIYVNQ